MLRAVVVDDEPLARRRLARLLGLLAEDPTLPRVVVVAEAGDSAEAMAALAAHDPSLLFLDIHLPGLSGLALAQRAAHLPPIVFTTAYEQHAVAAFEVNAVDYLLKPITAERLRLAVTRAAQRGARAQGGAPRLTVLEHGQLLVFDAAVISRFYATDKYTAFLADGREHLTEETLGALASRLAEHGFLRVHRGELVNLRRVRALHAGDSACEVELDDGQRARVSRRLLPPLRAALLGRRL